MDYMYVVGIDFGTSRSAFGWATRIDKRPQLHIFWPDQPVMYPKAPTRLLYSPEHKLDSWGWTAINNFAKNKDNNYKLFQKFKMKIGEEFYDEQKQFAVKDLVADYLREIKKFALEQLSPGKQIVKEHEILWSLSIPAIWSSHDDSRRAIMREAAYKAGLISAPNAENLVFVLEPEAASLYCLEKGILLSSEFENIPVNEIYMIVDAGGGTVDITVHVKTEDNDLETVVKGSGDKLGSTYVDEQFLGYLKELFSCEILIEYENKHPLDFFRLLGEWERLKCSITHHDLSQNSFERSMPISATLYRFLKQRSPNILKYLYDQFGDDQVITLTKDTIDKIFEPVLRGIQSLINSRLEELSNQNESCSYIILVGGFAASPLLQKLVVDEFSSSVKQVLIPKDPGSAVVWGTVAYALNPEIIRSRYSLRTYGFEISEEVPSDKIQEIRSNGDSLTINIDGQKYKVVADFEGGNKAFYSIGHFDTLIKAGEIVRIDSPQVRIITPVFKQQTQLAIEIYSTVKSEPKSVFEDDVYLMGKLIIDVSSTKGKDDKDRLVLVYYSFGSEITVFAAGPDGSIFDTSIEFETTYFPEQFN